MRVGYEAASIGLSETHAYGLLYFISTVALYS